MVIALIVIVVFLLVIGGGVIAWFISRQRKTAKTAEPTKEISQKVTKKKLPLFRWSYIIAPVVILAMSIILTAYFSANLPDEVAYHFAADDSPDKWLTRGAAIAWSVAPQAVFTLLAIALIQGTTRLSALFGQTEGAWMKPETVLSFMGNAMALPQIILFFVMLNIFSYNAYQTKLMPIWVIALVFMGIGAIIIGIFFFKAIRRAWAANK